MDASKPRLFDGPLNQYQSMVFATHGYFGKDLPGIMEPVLVLTLLDQPEGRDGFLRLSEVMGLKLNADVVALTACQTGLGRRLSGEGTMGMGRAFQYAGAKSVLMSLWSVEQTASAKLAEGFFKHLKEGKTKLEALRLARQAIRKQGFDHPFFWAAFILVGETQ
jgi:CHAT domain-containing protein